VRERYLPDLGRIDEWPIQRKAIFANEMSESLLDLSPGAVLSNPFSQRNIKCLTPGDGNLREERERD
jgi:hypothetical protein